MRFQDAARDARAIVYQGIQADPIVARMAELLATASPAERWLARAVMNGQRSEPGAWRRMFPSLFGANVPAPLRDRAEALLAAALAIADHADEARNQYRGAVVEELTARLLAAGGRSGVRRERRVLFDGVRAEIHPYDVTVEGGTRPEVYDCKWAARGIGADVLHQLDDARSHAADEDVALHTALVVFDARRSCEVRLARATAPHDQTGLVSLETLDTLAGRG